MSRRIFIPAILTMLLSAGALFASDTERLVASSDDLEQHREAFVQAATKLIENGTCTDAEFIENGGWVKPTTFKRRSVYFMYCGGATVAHRLYLDAATGEVFR